MVDMNPVLLKPTGNAQSQVIIMGEPVGNMSAREYHKGYSLKAWGAVEEALERLQEEYDMLVIEGAGSPAEINLKANDIVNMRVAKHLQAPVLLIADIDRGGALASLVGTLELLDEEERALVKGLVINKFRGDVTLLAPALTFLEEKTGKPVLGVVPHIEQLGIDEEDSVSLDEKHYGDAAAGADQLRIAVIRTPKLSNFTDFDALANEPDAALYYVSSPAELGTPDLILLPGSKNTTEDLLYIRESGLEAAIRRCVSSGTPLFGICGSYQMLQNPNMTRRRALAISPSRRPLLRRNDCARSRQSVQISPSWARRFQAADFPAMRFIWGRRSSRRIFTARSVLCGPAMQQQICSTEPSRMTASSRGRISTASLMMMRSGGLCSTVCVSGEDGRSSPCSTATVRRRNAPMIALLRQCARVLIWRNS